MGYQGRAVFGLLLFAWVCLLSLVSFGVFFGDAPLTGARATAFATDLGRACDVIGGSGGDAGVGCDGCFGGEVGDAGFVV
jgi:hypothetical protein